MPNSEDIRISRTRELLVRALLELMSEKDASRIGVVELTKKAQVNRSTFYLHYADMIDFLVTESHREVDSLIAYTSSKKEDVASDGFFLKFFEYVRLHADFFSAMLGPHGYFEFRRYLVERGREQYEQHLRASGFPSNGALNIELVSSYVVSAHQGVIQWWIDDGMQYTSEAIALAIERLTVKGVLTSLGLEHEPWIPS